MIYMWYGGKSHMYQYTCSYGYTYAYGIPSSRKFSGRVQFLDSEQASENLTSEISTSGLARTRSNVLVTDPSKNETSKYYTQYF